MLAQYDWRAEQSNHRATMIEDRFLTKIMELARKVMTFLLDRYSVTSPPSSLVPEPLVYDPSVDVLLDSSLVSTFRLQRQ